MTRILPNPFFDCDALSVAQNLLGKVIFKKHQNAWLSAMIIETEAYYKVDKGSHASLGFTEKRKALFMDPGTIYMYYARGGDSLNVSCKGEGNAVLIKSGFAYSAADNYTQMITLMQQLNPMGKDKKIRAPEKLCAGQTLLCQSLGLKVPEWDQQNFNPAFFYIADVNYQPQHIIQTQRLGISKGRDEHLPYRFVDEKYARFCTRNPIAGLNNN